METPRVPGGAHGLSATVHTAPRDISVYHVARLMKSRSVTTVVVAEDMKPVGIVTDRDIVLRVTAPGLDATRVAVGAIMTTPVMTMTAGERVDDGLALMDRYAIRQLPIVDADGRLVTLLGLDDLLRFKLAGAVTFTGLLPAPPPSAAAPAPSAPPIMKFSELGAPATVQAPPPAAVGRPIIVPMVKRRQWMRAYFAVRAWYHRNTKWMILMLAIAVVGTGVALVARSFYEYRGKAYEPKDSPRQEMMEKNTEGSAQP